MLLATSGLALALTPYDPVICYYLQYPSPATHPTATARKKSGCDSQYIKRGRFRSWFLSFSFFVHSLLMLYSRSLATLKTPSFRTLSKSHSKSLFQLYSIFKAVPIRTMSSSNDNVSGGLIAKEGIGTCVYFAIP